jgi:hypothetical protein
MPKVYIIRGDSWYVGMFLKKGFTIAKDIESSDLVQFTGGSDVNPALYDQGVHLHTSMNKARDEEENEIFNICVENNIPMAGICRGGQFLNVMCGGSMFQHVDKHTASHSVYDIVDKTYYSCTSTHHQMMIPKLPEGTVIGVVPISLCTFKEKANKDSSTTQEKNLGRDTEVVFYQKEKALCFQPHPEYHDDPCREWYFNLIHAYLKVGV